MSNTRPVLDAVLRGGTPFLRIGRDGQIDLSGVLPRALLSGSFNPLHAGHLRLAEVAERRIGVPVEFELPLLNADKRPLTVDEAERRIARFSQLAGICVTAAATFVEKARIFPDVAWVVGVDTAARIVQPRFYGDEQARDAALTELRAHRSRFLVAGRLDESGLFQGLEDLAIPAGFRDLFAGIPEGEFRHDVSSTELRMRS